MSAIPSTAAPAARGESRLHSTGDASPLARRVAPPSNTPGILRRRALRSGRLARLGATPDFHHGLLLCVLAAAGCGGSGAPAPPIGGPSGSTTTTTAPPSTPISAHYVGNVATLTQPSAPLDLSLFFNLPPGALSVQQRLRLAAVYQVTGGFNTGSGPVDSRERSKKCDRTAQWHLYRCVESAA